MVVRYTPSMSESTSTYTHISYESANANKSHKTRWRSNFYRMISLHLVYSFVVILRLAIIKRKRNNLFASSDIWIFAQLKCKEAVLLFTAFLKLKRDVNMIISNKIVKYYIISYLLSSDVHFLTFRKTAFDSSRSEWHRGDSDGRGCIQGMEWKWASLRGIYYYILSTPEFGSSIE